MHSGKILRVAALVGLGVVFPFLLLVIGSLSGAFQAKHDLHVFLPDRQGLRPGSAVKMDGIPIGSVESIKLVSDSTDQGRRVDIALATDKQFRGIIRKDSTASVLSDGLLGPSFLSVQRGTSPPLEAGAEIRVVPVQQATLTGLIKAISQAAKCPCSNGSPSRRGP